MQWLKKHLITANLILLMVAAFAAFYPVERGEGIVVLPYPPVSGTSIKATEMKANFDTCINGINALEIALTNPGNTYVAGATTTQTISTTTWTLPLSGATDQIAFASGSVITYDALIVGKLPASAAAGVFRVHGSMESYDNTLKNLGASSTLIDGNLSSGWGVSQSVVGNVFKMLASGTSGIQWRIVQLFYSQI